MSTEELDVIARMICELKGASLVNLNIATICFKTGFRMAESIEREKSMNQKGCDKN